MLPLQDFAFQPPLNPCFFEGYRRIRKNHVLVPSTLANKEVIGESVTGVERATMLVERTLVDVSSQGPKM